MRTPRWLDDAQMRAWLGYRQMRLLLDLQVSRDLAEDSGLSEADYDVLSNLSESDEQRMRVTELSAHMLWSKSRLSHHVTRMQRRGLVDRKECSSDERGAVLVLTKAGRQAIEAAAPLHVDSVRRHFIDLLSDEQIAVLGDIADTIVNHHRAIAGHAPTRAGSRSSTR